MKSKHKVAKRKVTKRKTAKKSDKNVENLNRFSELIKTYTDAIVKLKDETVSSLKKFGILK